MRVLVTGASGFVGQHLVKELLSAEHHVISTARKKFPLANNSSNHEFIAADVCLFDNVKNLIRKSKPDAVIHLAAMPHVGKSWKKKEDLIDLNVFSVDHLCRALAESGKKTTFLLISSAMIYDSPPHTKLSEFSKLNPNSPYGMSKLAAEMIARQYQSKNFDLYIARPFNHTGPGQSTDYVCPAFATRIFNAKEKDTIKVGNLKAERDFSDVRDIVKAYRLIIEKKPKEKLFVLGAGRPIQVKEILDYFIKISGKKLRVRIDPTIFRPLDHPYLVSNPNLAKKVLGWKTEIPIYETLKDIYESLR